MRILKVKLDEEAAIDSSTDHDVLLFEKVDRAYKPHTEWLLPNEQKPIIEYVHLEVGWYHYVDLQNFKYESVAARKGNNYTYSMFQTVEQSWYRMWESLLKEGTE